MAKAADLPEPDDSESASGGASFVQSFERGLAVIAAFDADHPVLILSEVARRAGVTRAAARRLLHTLVRLGYMSHDDREFALRPKVLELGYAYLSALSLPDFAHRHLERLAEDMHESSYLSVLDGHETVCVANVPVRRIWSASISVGTRLPAFATAAGRVMLADLPEDDLDQFIAREEFPAITSQTITDPAELKRRLVEARQNGWALVDHELEEGLRTLAVPVRGTREVIAAISVSTLAGSDEPDEACEQMLPPLAGAASAIEADARSFEKASPDGSDILVS